MSFHNKTILITGAGGNLGRAVATHFAENGAQLVLLDHDAAALQSAASALPSATQVRTVHANLLDKPALASQLETLWAQNITPHVLCNLAGGFRMGAPVHETTAQDWDFLFATNTQSLLNMVQLVVPRMLQAGGGKIINVAANAARQGLANMGAYCAAKDAVIRLTEAMAAELKSQHINVNCVLPSILDTPQNRADMPQADPAQWVSPANLAKVIAFLASSDAIAIHGAALPVTGLV